MLGGPGIQRAEGMLGFDWFIHQGDPQAGNTDLDFTGLLPPSVGALRDRFDLVEAVSGRSQDDVLRGDSRNEDTVVAPGDTPIGDGHTLHPNGIARISGLQDVVGEGVASYAAGNIIIGGDGSDVLEGRGGDDILDGDKYLDVRLSVRTNPANPGSEIRSARSMKELEADVFSGAIDPGNIVIVREILDGTGVGTDKALFSDTRASYECVDISGANPQPLNRCPREWDGRRITVSHLGSDGVDGVLANDGMDTVENVEELIFSDSLPPDPPTDVHAVAGNRNARISFVPSLSVVTGYEVQVLDAFNQQVGALRPIVEPADTSVLVSGLTNGQTYTFRVRGINDFGTGEYSLPSNAVTPHAEVPRAVGIPNLLPGNRQVGVDWDAPNDGGSPITGYEVRVIDIEGAQVGDLRSTTTITRFDVTGLTNGDDYFFSVRAENAEGFGPWSPEVGAVPRGRAGAPDMSGVDPRNKSVLCRWTDPADDGGSNITGYTIQVQTLNGRQVGKLRRADGLANRLVVSGLDNGRAYRFRVRAVNAAGASIWSASLRASPRR
jgi:Ca2+-binding RTX toxin-like protein